MEKGYLSYDWWYFSSDSRCQYIVLRFIWDPAIISWRLRLMTSLRENVGFIMVIMSSWWYSLGWLMTWDIHGLNEPMSSLTRIFLSLCLLQKYWYTQVVERSMSSIWGLCFRLWGKCKFYAKFTKYEFWLDSVALLGYLVSGEDNNIDPRKIEVVTSWPRPIMPT